MDITGIQTLAEVIGKFQKRDVRVILCEANERVFGKLRNAGVMATLRDGEYQETLQAALVQVSSAQAFKKEDR